MVACTLPIVLENCTQLAREAVEHYTGNDETDATTRIRMSAKRYQSARKSDNSVRSNTPHGIGMPRLLSGASSWYAIAEHNKNYLVDGDAHSKINLRRSSVLITCKKL